MAEARIKITYTPDNNQLGRVEELKNSILDINLHKSCDSLNGDGYDICFKSKTSAKKAFRGGIAYLKNNKLWDKSYCESDTNKDLIAWEIYYYNATAILPVKDIDSIKEE